MRAVNAARSLPNPTPWYAELADTSKKAFTTCVQMLGVQKKHPTRVGSFKAAKPLYPGTLTSFSNLPSKHRIPLYLAMLAHGL